MSNFKRYLPLCMAAACSISLISGCAGPDTNSSSSASTTSKAASEVSGEKPKLEQTAPVKFYCRTNAGKESAPDNVKVLEKIQELSGIQLEVNAIANEGYKEKIDLMIASGEVFDGMNLVGYGSMYSELIGKDAIVPINDLLDQYGPNIKKVMADGLQTTTDKDGKIWGLPRAEKFPEGYVPTIRKDWLEKFGMQMPTTIEELEAYFEAVKTKDPNGNGKADEIPLLPDTLVYGITNFYGYFLKVSDNKMTATGDALYNRYMDDDGVIWPIYCHPGYKDMLAKFAEWYQKGYLPQEIHVLKTAQITDMKNSGAVGMTAGWYSTGVRAAMDINDADPNANVQYEPIPPLQNAPGQSAWTSNPPYAPQIMVMKTAKNPEALISYFDWICSDPQNMATVQYGIEGTHWNWVGTDKSQLELIGDAGTKYMDYYSLANLFWKGTMPALKVSPENKVDFEYARQQDVIRGFDMIYPFDAHVPYDTKGTDAEFLTVDGKTLIDETIIKIIIGELPVDAWDKAIETYKSLDGGILSKVWTDQYNEFNK